MASRKRCLGVDLGSHSIKVAELAIERNGVRILKLASAPIEVDASASPAERHAAIAKSLRALLRAQRITVREAVFAIPGQMAFVRRFRLPATSPERLERIIRYEARQQIPFPLERTQLEYQVFPTADPGEVDVVLVAVRHDQIRDFAALIQRTGLSPVAVAIGPFALFNYYAAQARSFEDVVGGAKKGRRKAKGEKKAGFSFSLPLGRKKAKKEEQGAEAEAGEPEESGMAEPGAGGFEEVRGYVHVGASLVDLAIARHGVEVNLGFTRTVPSAGNEITRAIKEKCALETFDDAEKVKRNSTHIMTYDFDPEMAGEDFNAVACQAATTAMDRIVADLRRSLDFYISQPDGIAVDTLILSGGQTAMPGFTEYIEEKLGVSVKRLKENPAEWLTVSKSLESGEAVDLADYPIAIGLAFQGLGLGRITIDFLPREKKILRDFPYRRAAVMIAILAGIVVFASQAGGHYIELYRVQREEIEQTLISRQLQDNGANKADEDRRKFVEMIKEVAPALGPRDFWLRFLAQIQSVKPTEALIDTLVLDEDGSVLIVGVAERENTAAVFTRRLKDSLQDPKPIQEPQLSNIRKGSYPGFDKDVWIFEIRCQVKVERTSQLVVQGGKTPAQQAQTAGGRQGRGGQQPMGQMPMSPAGGRFNPYAGPVGK